MINNPFLSDEFSNTWISYFLRGSKTYRFEFLPKLLFFKKGLFYVNVGKNLTNGMCYDINVNNISSMDNKALLIYDVPSFFELSHSKSHFGIKKVKQYKGFLCDFKNYKSFNSYLNSQFKSNSRYKFRRNIERLELTFNIESFIYFGEIEKEVYDKIMHSFKMLIEKRFSGLKKYNDVVETWEYYKALVYPMIFAKKALLQCIKKDNEYIAVSLSFINGDIIHFAITSFDSDYKRYNLGHINIMMLIKWCFDKNISIFDFSKGENEYKIRWTNREYVYENHIIYNSKNLTSILKANILSIYFKLKQLLRDLKVNVLLVKFKFAIKNIFTSKEKLKQFTVTKMTSDQENGLKKLALVAKNEYQKLKPIIYDRLYKYPEPEFDLKVYRGEREYFVVGKKDKYTITIS